MRVVLNVQDDGMEEEELLNLIEETLAEEGIVAVAHMEEDDG